MEAFIGMKESGITYFRDLENKLHKVDKTKQRTWQRVDMKVLLSGVIKKPRGHNFTFFDHPPTSADIFYVINVDKIGIF